MYFIVWWGAHGRVGLWSNVYRIVASRGVDASSRRTTEGWQNVKGDRALSPIAYTFVMPLCLMGAQGIWGHNL